MEKPHRLNKAIALQLGFSRRQADDLIAAGRVRINGETAVLGARIGTDDAIEIDDKLLGKAPDFRYVAFFKPKNYVCSRKQQGDAPTIYSLLPPELAQLKPVGRLDKDSSGLLILTNDGDFAHRMTHPSFHKQKTYLVALDNDLEPLHQQMIGDYGVLLEDGPSKLILERESDTNRKEWKVLMHEGRNRQIRRTFAALGYTVQKLHRISFGAYQLDDMKQGEVRILPNKDVPNSKS